jgi:membrane-bound acyltransferase YfiQ involved in biofilm formation
MHRLLAGPTMADRESLGWRIAWEAPVIGELIQTIVLFFPFAIIIWTTGMTDADFSPGVLLVVSIVEMSWMWIVERFAGTRLVVPIIGLPWIWVFLGWSVYFILAMMGIVKFDAGV